MRWSPARHWPYDRIFLLSQSLMPALNAFLLGSLLHQSRLVPRVLPMLGFFGGALLVAGDIGVLFGVIGLVSSLGGSSRSPSRSGSFRWASTWSSKALGLRRSSPAKREMSE